MKISERMIIFFMMNWEKKERKKLLIAYVPDRLVIISVKEAPCATRNLAKEWMMLIYAAT